MKRLCAILLGLMMLAGLCACGRRTSPAPAPKTPEPVTVITPAQPTPSEAEVVPVSTPDGTTPLTAAELDWFGRCFFNVVPGWGPNRFLTCAYTRPEDMDLAAVLACGPEGSWNVTSQERNMIAAGGTDSVVRIPLEQAQELMLRYTGLALSDTQGVGLDSLRYLSEYNAYYRVGDEAEAAYCRILSGWHTADGLTVLQYDGGTVTLRQLAYFVESADVDSVNDQRAICKFQKADLIYRQILSIYSEYAGSASGLKLGDDSCKVIAFTSPCGGVGSSTMAAACALHYAARGKRSLYLSFERFGSSDAFFAAEGQFDMSGIIFALKSKKTNLSMKMESCVKQDPRGVYFYSQSKVALDMLELGADEIGRLISEARLSGNYEYVIADLEFGMDRASLQILRQAGAIVWTGDGSEISNRKLARAYQALAILEQNAEVPLTARIALIYNKFSNKSGTAVTGTELRSIGGAPRYEHASTAQVLEQLAPKELFDKIQ